MDSLLAVGDLSSNHHRLLHAIAEKMPHSWWSAAEITEELTQAALSQEVLTQLVAGDWIEVDPDDADWFTISRKSLVCLANDDQNCCFMLASPEMPLTYLGFSAELYRRDDEGWVIRVQLEDAEWIRQRLGTGLYYRGETII